MAQVVLSVGGRRYELACRDGEEAHLQALAAVVDAKAGDAARAVGGAHAARQLLLAALLLADDLSERGGDNSEAMKEPVEALVDTVEALAARMEALAERLESGTARGN